MTTTPTYPAGTLAYFDTFAGLIPCRVDDVVKDGPRTVHFTLTATRGAYKRGERLTAAEHLVVPRGHVFTRAGILHIRCGWRWE